MSWLPYTSSDTVERRFNRAATELRQRSVRNRVAPGFTVSSRRRAIPRSFSSAISRRRKSGDISLVGSGSTTRIPFSINLCAS